MLGISEEGRTQNKTLLLEIIANNLVADLGEAPHLFWVKKEEMTEGRKAGRASKTKLCPPLSSKSGFSLSSTPHSAAIWPDIFAVARYY